MSESKTQKDKLIDRLLLALSKKKQFNEAFGTRDGQTDFVSKPGAIFSTLVYGSGVYNEKEFRDSEPLLRLMNCLSKKDLHRILDTLLDGTFRVSMYS